MTGWKTTCRHISSMVKLLQGGFLRSVFVLMTGTAIAQAISYLISPFLTRLYTPEEMGDLGIYIRLIGFFSAFATLRYELAIPLPKRHTHSYLLYRLALRTSYYFLAGVSIIGLIYLTSISFAWNQSIFALITIVSTFFLIFINL